MQGIGYRQIQIRDDLPPIKVECMLYSHTCCHGQEVWELLDILYTQPCLAGNCPQAGTGSEVLQSIFPCRPNHLQQQSCSSHAYNLVRALKYALKCNASQSIMQTLCNFTVGHKATHTKEALPFNNITC